MSEELTDAELALISKIKMETSASSASAAPAAEPLLSLARLGLKRNKKDRGQKISLIPLAIVLIVVGLIGTLAFILAMQSVAEQAGSLGYFGELSEQLAGSEEFDSMFTASGFGWYTNFLAVYEKRWLFAGIIFSAFALLSALVLVIDLARKENK